jgi:catechol 2,3-dioxygenase-like lactoylglutathione lyase family enzyme
MITKISHIALLVRDQQEALDWYTANLGFKTVADMPMPGNPSARWVTVAPPGQTGLEVILQPPEWGSEGDADSRAAQVGKGQGFVLASTDCQGDCAALAARGVQVVDPPMEMAWGVSALIADLYGYVHNLVEPREF